MVYEVMTDLRFITYSIVLLMTWTVQLGSSQQISDIKIEQVINYTSQGNIFNTQISSPSYPSPFSINENLAYLIQNLPSGRLWINIEDIPVTVPDDCRTVPYNFRTSAVSTVVFVPGCVGQLRTLNRIITDINDLFLVLPSQTNIPPFRVNISIYSNIIPLLESGTNQNTTSIEAERLHTGYIVSHNTFFTLNGNDALYEPDEEYSLTLEIPPATTVIYITYKEFNIGGKTVQQCQNYTGSDQDRFTIHNGEIKLYDCGGGGTRPGDTMFGIASTANTISFQLKTLSRGPQYQGFLIQYRIVSCSAIPHATITRGVDPFKDFSVVCDNSGAVHTIECLDGTWSQTVNCDPPETSTIQSTSGDSSTTDASVRSSQRTSTKTTTPDPPANLILIIAASAGGGGVLLLIIIILLAVLVCRRKGRKSDEDGISPARHSGAYTGMSLSERPIKSETRNRQMNGEVNSGAYSSVDLEGDEMKPSIAVVAPNNSKARHNTASSIEDVPGLGNNEDDEQYANRETITRDRAQQGGTGDIYASILSSTKIKSTAPRQAAVDVAMVDNDLYGGVE